MAKERDLSKLDPTALYHHEAWEAEKKYPLFEVVVEGDEVEYTPRPDERYWKPEDLDGHTIWVSKTGKPVMLPDRSTVTLHAVNEEVARARALTDTGLHTVVSVKKLGPEEE